MMRPQQPVVRKRQGPIFNKGNKLRPQYESVERKAPKQTLLQPPMQKLIEDSSNQRQCGKIKKLRYSNTPQPLFGREHKDIQTDTYLKDQSAKATYNDFDTQTDDFLDRVQTPFFIPRKSGPDAFTQIFLGDLFDFEMEVEPMVEVLACRAIEQGFMEVQEEKQLAHLRCHQDLFEQMRVAELTATQRMEAAERRIMEEKDRRLKQEQSRLKEEQLLHLRTEAMGIAMKVLKKTMDEIYDKLTKEGYFYDPIEQELKIHFVPVLLQQMQTEVGVMINSRHAVAIMADEATPPCDTAQRAVDGVDIIMSGLMNVLDSWIAFEDKVMVELAASEQASQRVMAGAVGEVALVQHTSHDVTASLVDITEGAHVQGSNATRTLINLMLDGFDPQ